jgi:hypothetical protein
VPLRAPLRRALIAARRALRFHLREDHPFARPALDELEADRGAGLCSFSTSAGLARTKSMVMAGQLRLATGAWVTVTVPFF